MAPKKKAGGYGKASPAVAKVELVSTPQGDSAELRWVRSQLAKLGEQKSSGPPWLDEPHSWHEEQLEELVARLSSGTVPALPKDFKEGIADYLTQFDDQDVSEDAFYIDRELYSELLAPLPDEKPPAAYARAATSKEASEVVTQLKDWSDVTEKGLAHLQQLLSKHEASAEVQEVGITRLGALLADLREGKLSGSAEGLTPKVLTPIVTAAMRRFPRDSGLQRVSCSALRGIVVTDGGLAVVSASGAFAMIVETIKTHLDNMEVCKTGAGALYAVVQKTGPKAPERLALRATDALDVLSAALKRHPYELRYACEVTLPELKG
eukprot:TRINITY_DN35241_c0_g1_i1.p1 TRINITY_DN35241_c0_g1~~TRINITY_DN35241_c0_g1_i1.p1  ORF type:complete len:322 (-),score=71.48 TRINITY_DN35241_c0_g1_i1:9-974(-)